MPVGAPRPGLQVGAQDILPTGAEQGADRPRLRSSLLKGKCNGTAFPGNTPPRPSIPKSGWVSHSVSLANTFLGQRGPTHGGDSRSASEGAKYHAGVTWRSHLAPPICPR